MLEFAYSHKKENSVVLLKKTTHGFKYPQTAMFSFTVSITPKIPEGVEQALALDGSSSPNTLEWAGELHAVEASNPFMDHSPTELHPSMRPEGKAYATQLSFAEEKTDTFKTLETWRSVYQVQHALSSTSFIQVTYTNPALSKTHTPSYLIFHSLEPIFVDAEFFYNPTLVYLGLVSADQHLVSSTNRLYVHNLYAIEREAFKDAISASLTEDNVKAFGSASASPAPVIVVTNFDEARADILHADQHRIESRFYMDNSVLKSLFQDRHAAAKATISSYTDTVYQGDGMDRAHEEDDMDECSDSDDDSSSAYEEREVHFCDDSPSLHRPSFNESDRIHFTITRNPRAVSVVGMDLHRRVAILDKVQALFPDVDTKKAVRVECRPHSYNWLTIVGANQVKK